MAAREPRYPLKSGKRGVVNGFLYCLAGLVVGLIGFLLGGWVAIPFYVLANFLLLAGIWTVLFIGTWLIVLGRIKRTHPDPQD